MRMIFYNYNHLSDSFNTHRINIFDNQCKDTLAYAAT